MAQSDVPVAVLRSSSLEWIQAADRARVWPVYIGSEYRRLGERKLLLLEWAC